MIEIMYKQMRLTFLFTLCSCASSGVNGPIDQREEGFPGSDDSSFLLLLHPPRNCWVSLYKVFTLKCYVP